MLVKILKPDFIHEDDRGKLTQLVHDGWKQVNVIMSKKGCERGGHFHELNNEAFYVVSGELKLTLSKDGVAEDVIFRTGDMFEIETGTDHGFLFTEDTCLVSLYDKGVELPGGKKDILIKEKG
jgi:dTDP-4-dehydrorhamnose 3,5-epimerase and related enzymes